MHTFRGGEYVAALMAELSRAAIAQRIATARKQAGLDQHEVADLMHVHYRTVQDWESVKKQVTPFDRLDELSAVMGVTKIWLLHGEDAAEAGDVRGLSQRLLEVEDLVEQTREDMGEALELLRQLATGQEPDQESQADG